MNHHAPYCLGCGSERIAFDYTSDMDGAKISERGTLMAAAQYLTEEATHTIASGEGREGRAAWAVCLADVLLRICTMWLVREKRAKEEEKAAEE